MRKAALHNLGCKVNAYETEAMQQLLEAAGYEIVPFSEKAEVYIVNTCSVTNTADHKSRQMLHRARRQNPDAVVVAAGCYVQAAQGLLEKDPAVDIVIGNNRKQDLVLTLEKFFLDRERTGQMSDVIDIGGDPGYEPLSISRAAGYTRAFIKVQDGCSQFCSYCIIPYTRGRVRSRGPGEVEAEVRALAARGYQEVVLTGIHLSSYGVDFPEGRQEGLLGLVKRLHKIEGLRRIRLGSLEPRIVTEEFASALAGMEKFCPHFHLSLQSGCDETLWRMNRHYTTEEYRECCQILRGYFAHPAITTDVIVGFPAESEQEFAKTRAFLEQVQFYEMHVFKYSRREGTRAARMPGQVPEQLKAARSDVLLKLGREMSKRFCQSCLGRPVEVLLEEKMSEGGRDYMVGHTKEYVKAAVPFAPGLKNMVVSGTAAELLGDEILLLS